MRVGAEDMVHGRCDGIGGRVEGVVRSEGDDREGVQGMNHGEGHPGRWGEDGRTNSPLGEKRMWKGSGTCGRK
jgi:hypothetical protein